MNMVMEQLARDLIEQCDKMSRVYCQSFNEMNSVINNLSSLSDLDLSALGLYICKCVEQEINSTVVQLIRERLGVTMPDYFCKVDPTIKGYLVSVDTGRGSTHHIVRLNDYADPQHKNVLKVLPLGEAYRATTQLVDESPEDYSSYPVLFDVRFREIWRHINILRNGIAHCGTVIGREKLIQCVDYGSEFLRDFLPKLNCIKDELAPEGWDGLALFTNSIESPSGAKRTDLLERVNRQFKKREEPKATREDYYRWKALNEAMKDCKDDNQYHILGQKIVDLERQLDWFDIPFQEGNHVGLKDIMGNIVIPARYDMFEERVSYLHPTSVSAVIKNGQSGLVERYSGKETAPFIYDQLTRVPYCDNIFYFWKDGSRCYGVVDKTGREIIPCYIDADDLGTEGLYIMSGGKHGYYSLLYDFLIPPIYDNIIVDFDAPLIFVMDGEETYCHKSGRFIPKDYLKRQEEDDSLEYIEYGDLLGEWSD